MATDGVGSRFLQSNSSGPLNCAIPGCGRPTMRSSGKGLAEMHCRYHVQFRARHGSHWHPTYKAADLEPYLAVAAEWIEERREELSVSYPLKGLGDSWMALGGRSRRRT